MTRETHCTWLGTAGWLIRHGDTTLCTDPFLSRPAGVAPFPVPREELAQVDAILCTHGHFDHAMDLEQVARLSDAPLWAPQVVCRRLASLGLDPDRLHANETATPARLGELSFEVVPSRHITFDAPLIAGTLLNAARGGTFRELLALGLLWPLGSNSDYLIGAGNRRLYLAGSLGQPPARLREHRSQVALLPYNGRTDMPRVVQRTVEALEPRLVIFHHWDDFYPHFAPPQDPQAALPSLQARFPDVRFHVAQPGEAFTLESLLSPPS